MNKTALYINTFQPVHLGHAEDITYLAKEQGVTDLILGVSSSEQHHLFQHPFTLTEREHMLHEMIQHELTNVLTQQPSIYPIPDTRDIDKTYDYIIKNLPPFDSIVSRNEWIQKMCQKYGIPVISTPRNNHVRGETVRYQLAWNNQKELQKRLSPTILQYIQSIQGAERQWQAALRERVQPKIAVDIIIMDDEGYVTMIERGFEPIGLAFPGGMIEYGQTITETAIKEALEEINQQLIDYKIWAVIDDPNRDPRAHTITFPVYARTKTGENPTAGDDAAKAYKIHITELFERRNEVVLGGDKIVEKLFEQWKFMQSGSA